MITRLSLQKAGSFARTDVAGSVGLGVLRRFKVSFDYAREKMWLAPNSTFAQADWYDRSGTWLALGDAHSFKIADVVAEDRRRKACCDVEIVSSPWI